MRSLLLRLYPARWRARYGDEFELVLADRPLGPFDVADVVLGALDAHLHLRGLGAASQHGKGFAMSLRIGGYAAVLGGVLWFFGLAGSSINESLPAWLLPGLILAGSAAILIALVGLSAFQARRYPRLVWAAFAVPAIGAVVSGIGAVAMVVIGDVAFVAGLSPWYVWIFGTLAMFCGSALFAIATWLVRTLSRPAAALLCAASIVVVPVAAGITGGVMSEAAQLLVIVIALAGFSGGWIGLGWSALRAGRPVPSQLQGAMS